MTTATTATPVLDRLKVIENLKARVDASEDAIKVLEAAIDRDEALEIMMQKRGAQIMTFQFRTDPKMNKTGKPYDVKVPNPYLGRVKKVVVVNGIIGANYEKRLAKALEAKGKTDDRQSRGSWHRPVLNETGGFTALCHHKDDETRLYIRFFWTRFLSVKYVDTVTGKEVTEAQIKPFLTKRSENDAQILTYSVDAIEVVKVNKKVIDLT